MCSHQGQSQGPGPGQRGGPSGPQAPWPPPPRPRCFASTPPFTPDAGQTCAQEESVRLTSLPAAAWPPGGPSGVSAEWLFSGPRLVGVLGGSSELSCRIQHHHRPPLPHPLTSRGLPLPAGTPASRATRLAGRVGPASCAPGARGWAPRAGWPRRGLQAGRMGRARARWLPGSGVPAALTLAPWNRRRLSPTVRCCGPGPLTPRWAAPPSQPLLPLEPSVSCGLTARPGQGLSSPKTRRSWRVQSGRWEAQSRELLSEVGMGREGTASGLRGSSSR